MCMTWWRPITLSHSRRDQLLRLLLWGCASVAGLTLAGIVMFLLLESAPALLHTGWRRFVTDASWHPAEGAYALWPMLAGTLFSTVGALLLAAPLGLCAAVFCHWYAPAWLAVPYQRFLELFAGIPSVVFGFWGLVTLVPLINQWQPPGSSLLAGICILTLMILPTTSLLALTSLAAVPTESLRAASALGFGRWGMLWRVVMPSCRSGLWTAGLLAAGRALGETMAVLMVCGNVAQMPASVFDPVRTLTANMALEMTYAVGHHRSALFVSGLLLVVLVIGLVGSATRLHRMPRHV